MAETEYVGWIKRLKYELKKLNDQDELVLQVLVRLDDGSPDKELFVLNPRLEGGLFSLFEFWKSEKPNNLPPMRFYVEENGGSGLALISRYAADAKETP